jgi:hypothetical protein
MGNRQWAMICGGIYEMFLGVRHPLPTLAAAHRIIRHYVLIGDPTHRQRARR